MQREYKCMCVHVCVHINMEVNKGNKSDSMKKIEKQNNLKVMNVLVLVNPSSGF